MTEDMTVDEIEETVADIDDRDELEAMLDAEEDGKDRVTAKDAIEERLEEMEGDTTSDTAEEETRSDEHIRVKPVSGGGHIAGYSFGDSEVKILPADDGKVQQALSNGELQLVR